ncbi:hypothetical protein [Asaia platycodi]|uniref:hypothetical protein n=1 Tax=Asaia platycodi TaxID=610243 RepID=UPI000AD431EA|nr:hypothetical protein [Asaia platycodi]
MVFENNVLTEKPDDISVFLLHMAQDAPYFALAVLCFVPAKTLAGSGAGVAAKG